MLTDEQAKYILDFVAEYKEPLILAVEEYKAKQRLQEIAQQRALLALNKQRNIEVPAA